MHELGIFLNEHALKIKYIFSKVFKSHFAGRTLSIGQFWTCIANLGHFTLLGV